MQKQTLCLWLLVGMLGAASATGCMYPRIAREELQNAPLHLAVRNGNEEQVKAILKSGNADVNGVSRAGFRPLEIAATYGQVEIIDLLVAAGADVSPQVTQSSDHTPLESAVRHAETAAVRRLIVLGADVNQATKTWGPPLFIAVDAGHADIARLLLQHGADVNARGWEDRPLNQAIMRNETESFDVLLEFHPDLEAGGEWGRRPLHNAVAFGHMGMAAKLLRNGADVNGRDNQDYTPLHVAVQMDEPECVSWLVHHGASLEARNYWRQTPLMIAQSDLAKAKRPEHEKMFTDMIALLKRLGANE